MLYPDHKTGKCPEGSYLCGGSKTTIKLKNQVCIKIDQKELADK